MAKGKKAKPSQKSVRREPDAVDAINAEVQTLLESGYPGDKPISVNVSVLVPINGEDQQHGMLGIIKEVDIEDVRASIEPEQNGGSRLIIGVELDKHDVIELYKIVTGTHPHLKTDVASNSNVTPLQLR